MDWLAQAAVIAALFVLRLGIPLVIMLAVTYFLRRLDARWQAEAEQSRAKESEQARNDAIPQTLPELVLVNVPPTQPCWVYKQCPEARRIGCPAFQTPDLPCWLARYRAEGRIPEKCYLCELFSRRQAEEYVLN